MENITLSDSISIQASTNPIIYLEEYNKYLKKYQVDNHYKYLIFAYIFLQIYLENHFHYYLRKLLTLSIASVNPIDDWDEQDYVRQKLKKFSKFLESKSFSFDANRIDNIIDDLNVIDNVRNLLIHGHPITEIIHNNMQSHSDAKKYLNIVEFNKIILKANGIVVNWNELMKEISSQELLLQNNKLPLPHFWTKYPILKELSLI